MSSAGCRSLRQLVAQDKRLLVHVYTSFPAVARSSKHVPQAAALCSNAQIQPMQMQTCPQPSSALCLPLPDCEQCIPKDPSFTRHCLQQMTHDMKTRWIWEGRPTCCKPLPPQAGLGYVVSKGGQIRVQCQKFLLPEHSSDKSQTQQQQLHIFEDR